LGTHCWDRCKKPLSFLAKALLKTYPKNLSKKPVEELCQKARLEISLTKFVGVEK
jgi:hypothetical protein